MGKYTEALRKIEEERGKRIPESGVILPAGFNLKRYAIGIVASIFIVLLSIYAYGVYSGAQLKSAPAPVEIPPVSPVQQATNQEPNSLLLENVENMMQINQQDLPQHTDVTTERPAAEEPKPEPTPESISARVVEIPLTRDFYTVQVAAYEQEDAAKSEARKLIAQGNQPLILRGSKFFKLCISKFLTEEEANTKLAEIKASGNYRDAFVRFVKAGKT